MSIDCIWYSGQQLCLPCRCYRGWALRYLPRAGRHLFALVLKNFQALDIAQHKGNGEWNCSTRPPEVTHPMCTADFTSCPISQKHEMSSQFASHQNLRDCHDLCMANDGTDDARKRTWLAFSTPQNMDAAKAGSPDEQMRLSGMSDQARHIMMWQMRITKLSRYLVWYNDIPLPLADALHA